MKQAKYTNEELKKMATEINKIVQSYKKDHNSISQEDLGVLNILAYGGFGGLSKYEIDYLLSK